MDITPAVTRIERVDDIPLLVAQLTKMEVAALLDEHFPPHGNWQGLSLGEMAVVWLSYICTSTACRRAGCASTAPRRKVMWVSARRD